jgi:hypothetical protein
MTEDKPAEIDRAEDVLEVDDALSIAKQVEV